MFGRVRHSVKRDFATGVVVVFPLAITVWLVYSLWTWADKPLRGAIGDGLKRWVGEDAAKYAVPGIGIFLMVLLIWIVGRLARSFLGRHLVAFGESLLNRLPFVRTVYNAVKQLLAVIFGDKKDKFSSVVLFEFPRKGVWAIGFMTSVASGEVQESTREEVVNVFMPTTPNPTTGFLFMVPRKEVIPLRMSVEDAAKIIISGGLAVPASPPAAPAPKT